MSAVAASIKGGNEEKVAAAAAMMSYRGVRVRHAGQMSHVRLPTSGTDEHDQPLRMGSWLLGFVGALYDYKDTHPEAPCDADVVAALWSVVGPSCMKGRDGAWHVVGIGGPSGFAGLHMLCDYLAQKPLYYRLDEVACASELEAVASFGRVTPDRLYLSSVCRWGFCPDPRRTPYAEVSRVLPGEYVAIDNERRVVNFIADPLVARVTGHPQGLRGEVEDAVRRRVLSSEMPLACLLSGGLSSSIVYSLACRHDIVHPYFVKGYGDDPVLARGLVLNNGSSPSDLRLDLTETDRSSADNEYSDEHLMRIMQEPIDRGTLKSRVDFSEVFSDRVCLTGDGASELFGGYDCARLYDSQASDVLQDLVCWRLPILDRVMMRGSVEVRSPFLARRVVEHALALPRKLRTGKKVLRDLFSDLLPLEVINERKAPLSAKVMPDPVAEARRRVKLVSMFAKDRWPEMDL
jgi:asparagine synthetase B (glutamine-hydrolysing)